MIYLLFKPLDIKQQDFVDVPLFNLLSFTLYELNQKGLRTVMRGGSATKYSDRYEVKDVDYTDNTKQYIVNMEANSALYKNEIVTLSGDVVCSRDDGLIFKTQNVNYNKKSSIIYTQDKFVAYRGKDRFEGTTLYYNNNLNKAKSKMIDAVYQLKETK